MDSTDGQGTTFRLRFPLCRNDGKDRKPSKKQVQERYAREREEYARLKTDRNPSRRRSLSTWNRAV